MKSERRHELQHNELADWLIKTFETVKPYQNAVMAGVAAVVVAIVAYTVWSRQAASNQTLAWEETATIVDTGKIPKLTKIIEDYPNTSPAHMAGVVLGDHYLAEGCNQLFVNKATAQSSLAKAIAAYQQVLDQSPKPAFQERATFGLARAKESKGQADELKQADLLYAEVVQKWPNGAFAGAAKQRLADLKRPETMKMYDRFAKFDPKPAFTAEPSDRPKFDASNLPSEAPADISATLPKSDGGNEGAKATPSETAKPADEPAKQ